MLRGYFLHRYASYNTAVPDFFHNILLYLLGSRIFPVERIDIPLHAIHITAVDRLYNIIVVIAVGGTEQGGSFARKLLDFFVAGLNLTDQSDDDICVICGWVLL